MRTLGGGERRFYCSRRPDDRGSTPTVMTIWSCGDHAVIAMAELRAGTDLTRRSIFADALARTGG